MSSVTAPTAALPGTPLAPGPVRRHSMKSITRATILTGAILVASVAVEHAAAPAASPVPAAATRARPVTVPAGTVLRLRLNRGFGSDSRLEAPVSGTLLNPIMVDGR